MSQFILPSGFNFDNIGACPPSYTAFLTPNGTIVIWETPIPAEAADKMWAEKKEVMAQFTKSQEKATPAQVVEGGQEIGQGQLEVVLYSFEHTHLLFRLS